jgi:lipopolysaccharide transport system ATP-binding protein
LRDVLTTAVTRRFHAVVNVFRGRSARAERDDDFWAIRDVSFDVGRGEVLGIIGHNGAGKSTLLKTLCRIVEPTEGSAMLHGRVGSLLEVGTGFHSELTGRENIYLSGAILGMRRTEIARKFDEIVEFAETERFLDTPVKFYSTGMYMRLAFAVAAHLDPEILIVDEVLAVGDAAFQRKCIGKMSDVSKGGRTVLFVSHQISAIAALCSRCILMDHGRIYRDGPTPEVTALYQSSLHAKVGASADLTGMPHFGDGTVRMTRLELTPMANEAEPRPFLLTGEDLLIDIEMVAHADVPQANIAAILYDSSGFRLIDTNTGLHGAYIDFQAGQVVNVRFRFQNLLLKPGVYLIGLQVFRSGIGDMDGIQYAASLVVEANTALTQATEIYPGPYQCNFSHEIVLKSAESVAAVRGDVGTRRPPSAIPVVR